jgi:3-oxoacyl-[acyl-carrier protein] reductase
MHINFKNKIVIVVGGTRGIGLSISNSFLSAEAIVHIISRNRDYELEDNLANKYNNKVFFHVADSKNESELQLIANKIKNFDILVSNVGSGKSTLNPINESNIWNEIWDTNFTTSLNSARIFSSIMNKGGVITFISSIAGKEFIGAPTEYSVAKSAINSFSKMLSHRLGPDLRVNTILPGNIYFKNGTWDLKMQENPQLVTQMIEKNVPLRRFGNPDEVANLVLFISSDKAAFITGACITIDGGQSKSFN